MVINIIRYLSFWIYFIVFFTPFSLVASSNTYCNYPVLNTSSIPIPIVAWRLIENDNYSVTQEIKDLKDCGFNTAIYFNSRFKADSICQMAASQGLNIILGSSKLKTKDAEPFIKSLSFTENILCWYLEDEPHYNSLHELRRKYDNLELCGLNKPIYINLVGSLNKKYTGECKTLNEYLDTIENLLHPRIWSYDYYPISQLNDEIIVNYNQFFSSLKAFHDQSQKTGDPFWAFCQSMEFKNSQVQRPAAKLPYLRFEAFCALAFGAKGIVYWGYYLPRSKIETYISALTDSIGNKTKAWYDAQTVNREIKAFNDIFIHSTDHKIYICEQNILSSNVKKNFSNTIESILKIETSGKGVVLSDFKSNGNKYIILINLDVEKSQDIITTLKTQIEYHQLEYKRPESIQLKKIDSNMYKTRLSPGGYSILSYKEL